MVKTHRVGSQPLKKFFEGLHPDSKKLFGRKLREVTTVLSPPPVGNEPPSLEECFKMLGMCEMRLQVIREIEDRVRDYSGTWMRSIREVSELKEHCQNHANLIRKMILGYLQQIEKETNHGLCNSNQ
jgi:hypothetical protein